MDKRISESTNSYIVEPSEMLENDGRCINMSVVEHVLNEVCDKFMENGHYTDVNFHKFVLVMSKSDYRMNINLWNADNEVIAETVCYKPYIGYKQLVREYLIHIALNLP